ncbi:MAG: DUF444 family protein, partial [Spongiibacteraceae bacterium]|nr:DUF444 family protein [Spongiibacteraceae bacterium]
MSYLIDRRLNSKNRSAVNRQRFIHRHRDHIKKAVTDAITRRSITDMENGEQITIPQRNISEPVFRHGSGGKRHIVHPGNREFVKGDSIPRPGGRGGGAGQGTASNSGEGMDDFVFQITQEEFLEFMFDDLELPNLVKRQLAGSDSFRYRRAGYSSVGTPNQINVVRSLRSANARRIALGGPKRRRIEALQKELDALLEARPSALNEQRLREIQAAISA